MPAKIMMLGECRIGPKLTSGERKNVLAWFRTQEVSLDQRLSVENSQLHRLHVLTRNSLLCTDVAPDTAPVDGSSFEE
jgi:hypothetical protein